MEWNLERIEALCNEKRQNKVAYETRDKEIEAELKELGVYDLPPRLKVGDYVYDRDRNKYLVARATDDTLTIECFKEIRDADGNITNSYKYVETIGRDSLLTYNQSSGGELHQYYHPDRIDYELWRIDYLAKISPKSTVKVEENK